MPNQDYKFKKSDLKKFLKAIMRDFRLISPQPAGKGDFLFSDTLSPENISLDYHTTANSVKEFFFPAREEIFRYQKGPSGLVKISQASEEKIRQTVFFGLRPCDVRGVNFHDLFFSQEPQDELYRKKREKGIFISFACARPARDSCFCASMHKNGPLLEKEEGFDLQFIESGNSYLVEAGSKKGEGLIRKYAKFFRPPDIDIQLLKSRFREASLKQFKRLYDINLVYDKLKNEGLKELWDELGKRCTNCAGCEFICPTCFCFYTQDIESGAERGRRIRAWDSCTFSGYSRIAGGANPHEKNSQRISRRFFCKLYNSYNWFKLSACTGCGRCSFVCPVNLDMESFISGLLKSGGYQPLLKEL